MKKYSIETAVGIFLVIGLLCIGYMTVTLGHISFIGDNSYSLFARFTTVYRAESREPRVYIGH